MKHLLHKVMTIALIISSCIAVYVEDNTMFVSKEFSNFVSMLIIITAIYIVLWILYFISGRKKEISKKRDT